MRLTEFRLSSHGFWTRGFLILGSVGVLLGLAEVALRIFAPVRWEGSYHASWSAEVDEELLQTSSVPGLAYELVPGKVIQCWGDEVRVCKAGLRDSQPIERLPESVVRILALGDEVTFGRLVGQDECYPAVLESMLNGTEFTPGCEFEVLNMGVSGYSLRDAVTVLQYKGLRYDPDVIVVAYRLDDPERDDLQPMKLKLNGVPWYKHFHFGRWWNQNSLERAVRRLGDGDYYEYLHNEESPAWARVLDSFDRLRRLAHDLEGNELPLLLVLVPPFRGFDTWADYPYGELHTRLTDEAKRRGLEVLDLSREFVGERGQRSALSDGSELPNAQGHRQIAMAIRRLLKLSYPCLGNR